MTQQQKKKDTKPEESTVLTELKALGLIVLIALALRATVVEAYIVPTGSMEKTIMVGDFLIGNKFIYGMRTPDRIGIPYTTIGFDIPWLRFPAFRQPKSGDVVIFKYPHNPLDKYVKRLVARPGDTVEVRNRKVLVNGVPFMIPDHLQFFDRNPQPPNWDDPNIFPRGNGNKDNFGKIRIPQKGDILNPERDRTILWYVASLDGHSVRLDEGRILIDNELTDGYRVEQDYYFMMGDNRDQSYDSRFWGFVPDDYILGEALFIYFSATKRFPFITWTRLKRVGTVIK